jgi:uncharacterized protein (DUF608 family)
MLAAVVVGSLVAAALAAEPMKLSEAKWDFESGTLEGWTVVSGNLGKQPSSNDNDRHQGNFGKHGKYFIGTYEDGEKALGDGVTGEIRSPVFVVDSGAIALLVGGGNDANTTYVALCDANGDKELKKETSLNDEVMTERLWNVTEYQGKRLYLKIVDKATGAWGHVNLDYVRAVTKEEIARIEREKKEAEEQARKAAADMRVKWAEVLGPYKETVFEPMKPKVFRGEALGACQMPLGGIGAGTIYLGGDAHFRRWMIHDARAAQVPDAFFAVRTKVGDKVVARMLRTGENGVKDVEFRGTFPMASHTFKDDALPVEVSMETYSPFVPLDEQASSLPVVSFIIVVVNKGAEPVEVSVVGSLQNAVGRDTGKNTPGVENPGYGGNIAAPLAFGRWAGVEMTQDRKPGSMVLAAAGIATVIAAQPLEPWTDTKAFWAALAGGGLKPAAAPSEPSPAGKTWNGAVQATCTIPPHHGQMLDFLWTWHLPGGPRGSHAYESRFASAADVAKHFEANIRHIGGGTHAFRNTFFFDSTLPWYVLDRVSSQASTLVTGVVHWTKEGNVYGWEGLNCCHGGCTHVWNYEQTLAHLFPALERNMREMNLGPGLAPDGAVWNRFTQPDSPWDAGNEGPAADGHASTLSKTYREWRLSADDAWLKARYPAVKKAMEYWIKRWDGADEDGVARADQFNTYDTSVVGPNTFIGSQYLAALRASEEMAKVCGDDESAKRWRGLFEKGTAAYDKECWDDEYKYYVQRIPPGQRANDYGNGCHVDQVLGQWWALVNDLGYVLPEKRVDAALQAIWKWNMAGDISLYKYHYQVPRIFAWDKGKGLLCCAWPRGDYIPRPILYAEEVWTGCEYHAAASMIWEGMVREGLAVVKAVHERYNDGVRNPWNEIECGDHYTRAMSSWSVLLACQGATYVGPRGRMGFDPRVTPDDHRSFFSAAEGWGTFSQKREAKRQENRIDLKWGRLRLTELALGLPAGAGAATAKVTRGADGKAVAAKTKTAGGKLVVTFEPALDLRADDGIQVLAAW